MAMALHWGLLSHGRGVAGPGLAVEKHRDVACEPNAIVPAKTIRHKSPDLTCQAVRKHRQAAPRSALGNCEATRIHSMAVNQGVVQPRGKPSLFAVVATLVCWSTANSREGRRSRPLNAMHAMQAATLDVTRHTLPAL